MYGLISVFFFYFLYVMFSSKNITAKNSTTLYQYSPCKANSHNATEPPAVVSLVPKMHVYFQL